jgi:hypothetical protein
MLKIHYEILVRMDASLPLPEHWQDLQMDGTPLSVLMQQAAEMKTLELSLDRKRFDALPLPLRNSLYLSKDATLTAFQLSSCPFLQRENYSLACKEQGNILFCRENYWAAKTEYEKSLAVWQFVRSRHENWHHRVSQPRFCTSLESSFISYLQYTVVIVVIILGFWVNEHSQLWTLILT